MIIATRTLRLRTASGQLSEVPIALHCPVKREGAWFCDFSIRWPEGEHRFSGGGADSVQALVSAMQLIPAELYTSSYHREGRLFQDQPGDGYGFPPTQNIRDLLVGHDALNL